MTDFQALTQEDLEHGLTDDQRAFVWAALDVQPLLKALSASLQAPDRRGYVLDSATVHRSEAWREVETRSDAHV